MLYVNRYQYMIIIPNNQLLVKSLLKQYYIPVCVYYIYKRSRGQGNRDISAVVYFITDQYIIIITVDRYAYRIMYVYEK